MPHDPSAMLQSTSISVRRVPTQGWCSSFHIRCPGFCSCQSGDIFVPIGYDGQGYVQSWIIWNYNNQRHNSWQPTTHRALYRHQTEMHPQSFLERGLLICPTALALREGQDLASIQRLSSQGIQERASHIALFFCLTTDHWYVPSGALISLSDTQETPHDDLVLEASVTYICGTPKQYIHFYYLKAVLKSLAFNQPESRN